MTAEQLKDYDAAMVEWQKEKNEQHKHDLHTLNHCKNGVSDADFKHIEFELKESEHPDNFRIVKEPVGDPQFDEKYHYTVWIEQTSGHPGDNHLGTCCMKISDDEYLMWDYWM